MPNSTRFILVLAVITGVLLTGSVLLWYLAYGLEQSPPRSLELDALADTVVIRWGDRGAVWIEAGGTHDAMAALGYVHGLERAWSVILWRQAALGRLSEWFGAPALPLDRLTRSLALASMARASVAQLDDEARLTLEAYTDGFNTALRSPTVRLQQEFVLLGLEPEPWLPWHTLALERLFAWLASPPPREHPVADTALTAFYEADRTLHHWLHLHGFENSIAWIARDGEGTQFFQRHVYGDTALPFFQEVILNLRDDPSFRGASLPGTPFFPAGQSENAAWALLLTASPRLERIPWHPDSARVEFQRIHARDGAEHLISFWRIRDRLPFVSSQDAPPDSVWSLQWSGLVPGSDWLAWRAISSGTPSPFRLLEGHGLWIQRDGTWRVLGAPRIEIVLPSGIFVGSAFWSTYAAEFLRTQVTDPVTLTAWIDDAYSIWAAQTAPPLVDAVEVLPSSSTSLRDAVTYLRNWDYTYDRASIAASVFDRWMTAYLDATGSLPGVAPLDSAAVINPTLQKTLAQAVEQLTEGYGSDLSQWRWEHVQPDRRFFPIWSVETLRVGQDYPETEARFAAVSWPGHGHPSALAWGPSPTQRTPAAPAAWEAWHGLDPWTPLTIRRRQLDPHAPLGRYLISDRPPSPFTLSTPVSAFATTTLTPPAVP